MNANGIVSLLNHLGAHKVGVEEKNVHLSCILAPWTHAKGTDSDPSMGIKIADDDVSVVNCYACGFKSTLVGLVRELAYRDPNRAGINWEDLEIRLSAVEQVNLSNLVNKLPSYEGDRVVKEAEPLPEVYIERYMGQAHPYILERGLRIDPTLRTWEVGYDRAARRIFIPVRNLEGRLVGAVGRAVDPQVEYRYINYWKFPKGLCLYGAHLCKHYHPTIVVEGPINALRVWQALHDAGRTEDFNVVAIFGSEMSRAQHKLISQVASSLLLFLDNDEKGIKGRDEINRRMGKLLPVLSVNYDNEIFGGDPDEIIFYDGTKVPRPNESILGLIDTPRIVI